MVRFAIVTDDDLTVRPRDRRRQGRRRRQRRRRRRRRSDSAVERHATLLSILQRPAIVMTQEEGAEDESKSRTEQANSMVNKYRPLFLVCRDTLVLPTRCSTLHTVRSIHDSYDLVNARSESHESAARRRSAYSREHVLTVAT
ncbi:hypothetical protein HN011_010372 [Eciton burchellii]|nr:hypothetical protein HN011_010372 [Eciton burchellii]